VASCIRVNNLTQGFDIIEVINRQRTVRQNNWNSGSSRAHLIYKIIIRNGLKNGECTVVDMGGAELGNKKRWLESDKENLGHIDLRELGSSNLQEIYKREDAERIFINQSCSNLRLVVKYLKQKKTKGPKTEMPPYKNAKLTNFLGPEFFESGKIVVLLTAADTFQYQTQVQQTLEFGWKDKF
jgi:hypothetical protein